MPMSNWRCYIVRCSDNSLYTGITNNLEERVKAHNEGRAAKYTKGRRPVALVSLSGEMTRSRAQRLEMFIKSLHPADKINALDIISTTLGVCL